MSTSDEQRLATILRQEGFKDLGWFTAEVQARLMLANTPGAARKLLVKENV